MMNRSVRFVFLLSFISIALVAGDVPDRVNVEKFKGLYDTQKTASDAARTSADGKRGDYEAKRDARTGLERDQKTLGDQLTVAQSKVTDLGTQATVLDGKITDWAARIGTNETALQALAARIDELSTQINDTQTRIFTATGTVKTSETARTQSATDYEAAGTKLSEVSAKLEQFAQDRVGFTQTVSALLVAKENLANELEKVRTEREDNGRRLHSLRESLRNAEKDVARLAGSRQQQETARVAIANQVAALQNEIGAEQTRIDNANAAITGLDTRIGQLNAAATRLGQELSNLAAQATALKSSIAALHQRKAALEGENVTLGAQLNTARAALGDAETKEQQASAVYTQLAGEVEGLKKALGATTAEIERLNGVIAAADRALQTTGQQLASLDGQLKKFGETATAAGAELARVELRESTLGQEITALGNQVSAAAGAVAGKRQAKTSADAALASATATADKLEADTKSLKEQVAKGEPALAQLSALEATEARLKTALATATQNLASAQNALAAKNTELANLGKALTAAQDELKTLQAIPVAKQTPAQKSRITQLSSQVTTLGGQIASARNAVTSITGEVNRHSATKTSTESQLATATASVAAKKQEVAGLAALKQQLAVAQAKIEGARQAQRQAATVAQGATQALAAAEKVVADLNAKLSSAKTEQSSIPARKTALHAEKAKAEADAQALRPAREALAKQLAATGAAKADAVKARETAAGSQKKTTEDLQAREKLASDATQRLGATHAAAVQAKKNFDGIAGHITANTTEIAAIPGEVQKAQGALGVNEKRAIDAVREKVQTEATAKGLAQDRAAQLGARDAAAAKQASARNRLTQPLTQIGEIDRAISALDREIAQQGANVAALQKDIGEKQTHGEHLARRFKKLTEEQLPAVEVQLQDTRTNLATADRGVTEYTNLRAEWTTVVTTRKRAFETADATYAQAVAALDGLQRQIESLSSESTQRTRESDALKTATAQIQTQLTASRTQRQALEQSITTATAQVTDLQTRVTEVETKVASAADVEKLAQEMFAASDDTAKGEEAKTASALTTYQATVAQYEKEKGQAVADARTDAQAPGEREAKERGETDGTTAGESAGTDDGRARGEKAGKQRDYDAGVVAGVPKGEKVGNEDGSAQGKEVGARDGKASGYETGLKKGYDAAYKEAYDGAYGDGVTKGKSEESREKGFAEGRVKGKARAEKTATTEDYPRGRSAAEAALGETAPAQTIDIDNDEQDPAMTLGQALRTGSSAVDVGAGALMGGLYANNGIGTEVGNGGPHRMPNGPRTRQFILESVQRVLFATVFDPTMTVTPEVKTPATDFRFRDVTKTFDHPDFETAYRAAYDEAYKQGYEAGYPGSYKPKYDEGFTAKSKAAYDEIFAKSYADDQARGEKDGYQTGYDRAFAAARKTAFEAAFADAAKVGETEGWPVRREEGLAAGKKDGFDKGVLDGAQSAYADGLTAGDAQGFDESLADARKIAFEKGKADFAKDLSGVYRVGGVEATLTGGDEGVFQAGATVALKIKVRNFGGLAAPAGKISVKVTDENEVLSLSKDYATLRQLPADTAATYLNVITGTTVGGQEARTLKLKIEVKVDGKTVFTTTVEGKVETGYFVSGVTNPIVLAQTGYYYGGGLWVKNPKAETSPELEVLVAPVDSRVAVQESWITVPGIAGNGDGRVTFNVGAKESADYSKNVFTVSLREKATGKVIFKSRLGFPLQIGQ